MKYFLRCCCVVWLLGQVACSKGVDLDAPCPDFGRYCPQTPMNESITEDL